MPAERVSRSRLLSLLSEACEVEHGLACSYLYAAFSLKRGQADGLTFAQEQKVRRWASDILFVATQEMLHLAQAWNLLQAVGGTPYHLHPPFPVERAVAPIPVRMSLEGFSPATLRRFMAWERPMDPADTGEPITTVGELYDEIDQLIASLPESTLFVTDPALQVGPDLADFPDLIPVIDRRSARNAIARIREQGEGRLGNHDDCHFSIFRNLRAALDAEQKADPSFAPAHAVVPNPTHRPYPGAKVVTDPSARRLMELFNDIYGLAMRVLAWIFGNVGPTTPHSRLFARFGIVVMPVVLRPLGELIMRVPSGIPGQNAGPSFSMARHVPLPDDASVAQRLVTERTRELAADLDAAGGEARVLARALARLGSPFEG